MNLTPTFALLLHDFRSIFTEPTFRTFVTLASGWILSPRQRFITECIFSGGAVGEGHWYRFHRFFSHAAWALDSLCGVLARLLVAHFVPNGSIRRSMSRGSLGARRRRRRHRPLPCPSNMLTTPTH